MVTLRPQAAPARSAAVLCDYHISRRFSQSRPISLFSCTWPWRGRIGALVGSPQSVPVSSGPGLGLRLGRDMSDMVLGPGVASQVAHKLGLVHLLICKLEIIGLRFSLPHSFGLLVVIHKYFVGERSHPSSDFPVNPGGTHSRVVWHPVGYSPSFIIQ